MYLQSARNVDNTPIPHVDGKLAFPLTDFFIYLRTSPMKRSGRREAQTIQNIFAHMKILFDYCVDLGSKLDQINYDVHLHALRGSLKERGVTSGSVNTYYRSWRSFYEWCDSVGIPHLMQFPAKIDSGGNFRSSGHILNKGFGGDAKVQTDPGLDSVSVVLDYKEKIVNDAEFKVLSNALIEVDPVYAHIAYMMVTTGLRIGGVTQLPIGANAQNPTWLLYPELYATGRAFQKFTYIPKGRKRFLKCLVMTEALGVLHNEYVLSLRKDRLALFEAKNQEYVASPLWLNCNGKEVKDYDVWAAFRQASEKLGRRITPHFLRHTYASYVVYYYFKAHNLKPNLAYAHDIHEQLRLQLGHSDLEVTKMYVRTVILAEMEAWLPHLTPHMKREIDLHIPSQVLAAVTNFFEPG